MRQGERSAADGPVGGAWPAPARRAEHDARRRDPSRDGLAPPEGRGPTAALNQWLAAVTDAAR
jgi:hypothetical protein